MLLMMLMMVVVVLASATLVLLHLARDQLDVAITSAQQSNTHGFGMKAALLKLR